MPVDLYPYPSADQLRSLVLAPRAVENKSRESNMTPAEVRTAFVADVERLFPTAQTTAQTTANLTAAMVEGPEAAAFDEYLQFATARAEQDPLGFFVRTHDWLFQKNLADSEASLFTMKAAFAQLPPDMKVAPVFQGLSREESRRASEGTRPFMNDIAAMKDRRATLDPANTVQIAFLDREIGRLREVIGGNMDATLQAIFMERVLKSRFAQMNGQASPGLASVANSHPVQGATPGSSSPAPAGPGSQPRTRNPSPTR